MDPQAAYEDLLRRGREQAVLGSCASLLGWDEQTLMPPGGAEYRGEQVALLAGLVHDRATDPRIGDLLGEVEASSLVADPDSPEAANVREIRRAFTRQTCLPRSLVEELARTTSVAQGEWVLARRASDFARFRPWLETILGLKRQEAQCVGFETSAYDALLDDYEPGATERDLSSLFEGLRAELVPLVASIVESGGRPDPSLLRGDYPIDRQRIFGETVAAAVGFDFARGRLDTTAHPFCSGIGPGDCRITTRFDPSDFTESLFSILHEAGHALYEQGLDPAKFGTPMGEAVSLGLHESQSRMWENAVGRGAAFWSHFLPMARQIFREPLRSVSPEAFLKAIHAVEPSLIRIQADEVTYNLHILIRFGLERDLIAGNLTADDVPGAWNEAYRRDLGVSPENDAEGCLQDIHWSAGLFGYFPTYTLGNVYAAQLFAKAKAELGDLDAEFARGDFSGLLGWLRRNVHRHGKRYRAADLIRKVTGSGPDPGPLVRALRQVVDMQLD